MSQYINGDHPTTGPDDRSVALRDYIGTARWFGGKGRSFTVSKISDLGWLHAPGHWPAVRTEIVELSYPATAGQRGDGLETGPDIDEPPIGPELTGDPDEGATSGTTTEFYQLLMAYYPADGSVQGSGAPVCRIDDPELGAVVGVDGALDDEARRVLLIRLLGEYAGTDDAGSISFRLRERAGLDSDLPSSVFGGQQSNTSIMFGDVAMLKLFRRLELGRNLDIEAHQVLSDAGLTDVARLYGWAEGTWTSSRGARHTADFGMLVEKLAEATDGWELALDRLNAGADFSTEATALGSALREIHDALRANFATDLLPGAELADVMDARLAAATEAAPQLADYAAGLRRRFDSLRGRELEVQRVHGDFHLGQTLHTPTGWKIIDFEGEPAKTMAERVAPDNVWRDVAGLLRSFDYAAASVSGEAEVVDRARRWAEASQQAFLLGYTGGAGSTGHSGGDSSSDVSTDLSADVPAEPGLSTESDELLHAYIADKAVYEVVYEVRNRPDWVHIPLASVALLARS